MRKLLETFQELNLSNYGPDDVDQLNAWAIDAYAELSALKAQEPVAEIALSDDGYKIGLLGALRNHRLPIGTKLYAAPVSEAKAQDFDPLVCDYCNAETQDPWHGSGMLNGVESRHIHACSQCRNLLPTAKAQGDAWAPSVNDYDHSIHSNPDAREWADFFVATFPGLADKHDLMIGWFANAMMAMHDHLARKAQGVVIPSKMMPDGSASAMREDYFYDEGWNDCIDEVARLNAAPAQQPKCKTCDDNGRIGGPSFYAPDEGGEPCPDCCSPVQQVSVPDGFVLAKETVVEMPDGSKELGYTIIGRVGIFNSAEEVFDAIRELDLPLGWVSMTTEQLLPGWMLAAAPAAPAADAGIVDMYRHLQKVTPYRFKKIQDASITDGGDVMYFHKDRFDAALLADMAAHCAAKGVV